MKNIVSAVIISDAVRNVTFSCTSESVLDSQIIVRKQALAYIQVLLQECIDSYKNDALNVDFYDICVRQLRYVQYVLKCCVFLTQQEIADNLRYAIFASVECFSVVTYQEKIDDSVILTTGGIV